MRGAAMAAAMTDRRWRLLIHGGAGSERIAHDDPAHEASARAGLEAALEAGAAILARGGSAVDAVEAAARLLEENACFNAGRGSVLTEQGEVELDAAIMEGRTATRARSPGSRRRARRSASRGG